MRELDEKLNDVFRKLYPGWDEGRLNRDPEKLDPIAPRDPRVAEHPALRITDRRAERIKAIRELAAQGKSRKAVSQELDIHYAVVCQIAKKHGIEFAPPVWGQYTRDRK